MAPDAAAAAEPLRVLQITDTHLFPDTTGRLAGVDTRATLAATLDAALAEDHPDLLLLTGDLAQEPHAASYAALEEIVQARYAGERLCVPGNHDDPKETTLFARSGWSQADWAVIGLDSRVPDEEGGRVAASELTRLLERIDAAPQGNLLVAVQPPAVGACVPARPWTDRKWS